MHSVCTSAASVSDVHMLPDLLHGAEKKVWGDAGYQGQTEAIHAAAPEAQDMTSRRTKRKDSVDEVERRKNRTKARVRSKVEWPFRILKRVFGYTRVRYRGLKKNHEWLLAAFALVNLSQLTASGWSRWGRSALWRPEIRPPEMQINLIKQRLAAILTAVSAGTESELHRPSEW